MYDICFTSSFGICFATFVFFGCSPLYVRVGLFGVPAFAFILATQERFAPLQSLTQKTQEVAIMPSANSFAFDSNLCFNVFGSSSAFFSSNQLFCLKTLVT